MNYVRIGKKRQCQPRNRPPGSQNRQITGTEPRRWFARFQPENNNKVGLTGLGGPTGASWHQNRIKRRNHPILDDTGSEAVKFDPASKPAARVANENGRRLDSRSLVITNPGAAQSSFPGRKPDTEEATPPEVSRIVTHKIGKVQAKSLKLRVN